MKVSKFRFFSILAVVLLSLMVVVPTFLDNEQREKLPDFLKDYQIALGLDLKGGAYILLEADINSVIREKNSQIKDIVRK